MRGRGQERGCNPLIMQLWKNIIKYALIKRINREKYTKNISKPD
jgi:hypothetical protein